MEKEVKLIKKVKHLIRKAGLPRWLHHYGPKTYEFLDHAVALLMRAYCRLSFRRVKKLFNLLGMKCPTKSALHYTTKNLSVKIWQYLLSITANCNIHIGAIDSTGFNKSSASQYYLKRIHKNPHNKWTKLSAMFDTRRKKIASAKVRIKPAHDTKDIKFLLKKKKPKILVADKGYDSEKIHEFAYYHNILPMIAKKHWTKRGLFRRKHSKMFRERTYHRREIAEALFFAIKRTLGSSINAKKAVMQRAEIYCRLICYNIFSFYFRDLGQSLFYGEIYKF